MLDATVLKNTLKSPLIAFWKATYDGESGMSVEDYADTFCRIIAETVVEHITTNAVVKITGGQTVAVLPPASPMYGSALAAPSGPVTGNITTPAAGLELEGEIS